MRKELYAAIKAKIEGEVPEVKHVDLWNHNVEFIEQETAWGRPAVFVEFGTITWSAFHGGGQRGRGVVRVHLVTDWVEGGYEAAFDLGRKLYGVLEGMNGECFDGMALVETSTNHNHEEITGERGQLCGALPACAGRVARHRTGASAGKLTSMGDAMNRRLVPDTNGM